MAGNILETFIVPILLPVKFDSHRRNIRFKTNVELIAFLRFVDGVSIKEHCLFCIEIPEKNHRRRNF